MDVCRGTSMVAWRAELFAEFRCSCLLGFSLLTSSTNNAGLSVHILAMQTHFYGNHASDDPFTITVIAKKEKKTFIKRNTRPKKSDV